MSHSRDLAKGFVITGASPTVFGYGIGSAARPATGRVTLTLVAALASVDLRNTLILVSPIVYDVFTFRAAQPRLFSPYTGAFDVLTFDNTHTLVNNDFSFLVTRL